MRGNPIQTSARAGSREDLSIPFSDPPPTLAFESVCDECRTAACSARVDQLVDELDKLIGEAHRDLLTHPKRRYCQVATANRAKRSTSRAGTSARTRTPSAVSSRVT